MSADGKSAESVDPDSAAVAEAAVGSDFSSEAETTAKRSLTHDVFRTYGTRVLILGLAVFNGVITSRMLGPRQRGIFALIYQFAGTVVTFAKIGLAQATVYSIRRERIPTPRVTANALFMALSLGIAFVALTLAFRNQLLPTVLRGVPQWALLLSLPLIPILLFESYIYAILQALGEFDLYNRRMLIGAVLLLLGFFTFLVVFKGGLPAAILVVVCNPMLMDLWLLTTISRRFPLSLRPDFALLKRQFRFGLKSYTQVLAQHLHLRADIYLVAYFLNPSEVAFYSLAGRLAEFMLDLPRAVNVVLYPRLASLDDRTMQRLTARACRRTVMLTGAGGLLMSLFGPRLIVLWYGEAYAPAGRPLPILCFGVVMMSVYLSLTQSFTSRNRQQVNIAAGLIALIGNLGLNVVLIPSMGIVGAAIASTISYSVAAAVLLVSFVRTSQLSILQVLQPQREDVRYFWNIAQRTLTSARARASHR